MSDAGSPCFAAVIKPIFPALQFNAQPELLKPALGTLQRTTMKPSPLLLKWISYPRLSFEAKLTDGDEPVRTRINATVSYFADGNHGAELHLESVEAEGAGYTFSVDVVAMFGIDVNRALETYRCSRKALPGVVSVNIARVLYSGARELLAMATARAPHGAVMIESVLVEPADVKIGSKEAVDVILREVFGVEDEEQADESKPKKVRKAPAVRRKLMPQ